MNRIEVANHCAKAAEEFHWALVQGEKQHAIYRGLLNNFNKHGALYCPCTIVKDDDTICPCTEMRELGRCRCGLYVRQT